MSIEGYKKAMGDVIKAKAVLITALNDDLNPLLVQTITFGVMANAQIAIAEIAQAIHQRLMNLALKGEA